MKCTPVIHLVEGLHTGGLEKTVRHIVVNLDRARFDPEVWCLARRGQVAEEIGAAGVPVRVSSMGQRPSPAFLCGLARDLRRSRAGILHCHGYTACTVGRVAATLAWTPKVFAHIHTLGQWLRPRQRLLERALSTWTTKVICVSQAVREFVVQEEHIPLQKTAVIYNGIPDGAAAMRQPDRPRFGIPAGARVVGCVASLERHKGHAVLAEAARLARAEIPDLVLLVVGDGSLRTELERRVRDAQIPAIFTGRIDDVGAALATMDVLALLSLSREGLSLAVIEAMAASKPVIATRIGGLPEAVQDGHSGLLCDPGNAEQAARCIMTVLRDHALRQRLGEAGRRIFLDRFTVGRMTDEIERLYGA
ncbi:MAG TPA: glycosyltransferase [Candidatus Sulfotelmatobacter sp.]|nr:glycosyltransferase [Candidatus Sulfotelmatobacter sp.]